MKRSQSHSEGRAKVANGGICDNVVDVNVDHERKIAEKNLSS